MKNAVTKAWAFGCFLLFANLGGLKYSPILIEAKIDWYEPIDEYTYEPDVEVPIFVKVEVDDTPDLKSLMRDSRFVTYIEKYREAAEGHRIPAGIKLAQGLLESDAGNSKLARETNNHFGIKCFSKRCHKGHCFNYTDDSHKDFFKKYKDPKESFRDHDEVFKKENYNELLSFPYSDAPIKKEYRPYKEKKKVDWYGTALVPGRTYTFTGKEWWAIHLCASGYATSTTYATKIDKLIKLYDL
jgi:flagellum-specific peptidoglycan hydrolase FlgJ